MSNLSTQTLGRGRFQSNDLGWFGATLGSTTWMMIAAFNLIYYDGWILALLPVAAFAIFWAISISLWFQWDNRGKYLHAKPTHSTGNYLPI